ncbi:FMN-dependent NADH-azoreductase [Albibacillus kandeliae]|uniref:FMN-dependent NADH-azoreductase n=1 Tax=Albibacillus kandeliae TaxID=2174228 RepID=UPI000D694DC9|nr:NAD(P)H-dependent oxidoreductase [Albibacillus kandeliae]
MTTLLHIDSSVRPSASVSRALTSAIVKQVGADKVIYRDLSKPLPAIDEAWIGANFTPAESRSAEQTELLSLSEELLGELEAADTIVIGAAMYNFGVSAPLKTWIDLIARAGRSFKYTEAGPQGLLTGKKAIIAVATGGTPVGSDFDFVSGYLKFILNFVGISDVTVIKADQVDASLDEKLVAVKADIEALAA